MFNFDDYKGKNVVMHCRTLEEAVDFCSEMNKAGLRWISGDSYLKRNSWGLYKQATCYWFEYGQYCHYDYYKRHNYKILEWSDYMSKTFTKADLQDGDICVQRDGTVEVVNLKVGSLLCIKGGYNYLNNYNDNLTRNSIYNRDSIYNMGDIMQVYRPTEPYHFSFSGYQKGDLVFDRARDCPKVKEISIADLEKQYGCKVKIIK